MWLPVVRLTPVSSVSTAVSKSYLGLGSKVCDNSLEILVFTEACSK